MRLALTIFTTLLFVGMPLSGQQKAPGSTGAGGEPSATQDPVRPTKAPPRRPDPAPGSYRPEDDKNLTPEQRAELTKKRGTRGYVRFEHSCEPARVPPGGSGKLTVVMVLQGDSVLPDPPPVYFAVPPNQGVLQIGTPTFRPGKPARLAEAFKGKLAYDHYAVFDAPFSVAATALPGQQALVIDLSYDLYNGKTGGHIDRFTDRITAQIAIGTSSEGPPGGGNALANVATAPRAGAGAATSAIDPQATKPGELMGDVLPTGASAVDPDTTTDPDPMPEESDGSLPLPLLRAGAVLLAGIAVLALRRRG